MAERNFDCDKCVNNDDETNIYHDEYPYCICCLAQRCMSCTTRDKTECKDFKESENNG